MRRASPPGILTEREGLTLVFLFTHRTTKVLDRLIVWTLRKETCFFFTRKTDLLIAFSFSTETGLATR